MRRRRGCSRPAACKRSVSARMNRRPGYSGLFAVRKSAKDPACRARGVADVSGIMPPAAVIPLRPDKDGKAATVSDQARLTWRSAEAVQHVGVRSRLGRESHQSRFATAGRLMTDWVRAAPVAFPKPRPGQGPTYRRWRCGKALWLRAAWLYLLAKIPGPGSTGLTEYKGRSDEVDCVGGQRYGECRGYSSGALASRPKYACSSLCAKSGSAAGASRTMVPRARA